jgi:hypothetical protein
MSHIGVHRLQSRNRDWTTLRIKYAHMPVGDFWAAIARQVNRAPGEGWCAARVQRLDPVSPKALRVTDSTSASVTPSPKNPLACIFADGHYMSEWTS